MAQKYFVEVLQDGHVLWHRDPEMKTLHRVGGPAVEHPRGYSAWYQDGKLHRVDGPAIEHADGRKEYWIEGVRLSARQFPKRAREFNQPRVREMTMAELEAALGHPIKIIK